MEFISHPL